MSEQAKHTPGPWMCEQCDGAPSWEVMTDCKHHMHICYCRGDRKRSEIEANARLIAAAPQLLAACEAASEHVQELREAWMTGALSECDGKGGTRSNRNVDVDCQLRKAIQSATESEATP